MVCGFCGTEINPGFDTCSKCGAVYRKVGGAGCLIGIMGMLSALLFLVGAIFFGTGHVLFGLVTFAVGAWIIWMSSKIERKRATYHWVERP
jgi:hypothetical protein